MIRIGAVALLLFMAFDFGVDLWHGEVWDSDSSVTSIAGLQPPSSGGISGASDETDIRHECVCCCTHVEHQATVTIAINLETSPGSTITRAIRPDPARLPIFHPPQRFV
jgi:hypothetical protein